MVARLTLQSALLEQMSDAEQRNLYALLGMKFDKPTAVQDNLGADEQLCWDVLAQVLREHGISQLPPLTRLATSFGASRLHEAVAAVNEYVRSGCSVSLSRTEHRAVLRLVLNSLCDYVMQTGKPLGPRYVLNSISLIPVVMNRILPGYHAAKLLHKVARVAAAA